MIDKIYEKFEEDEIKNRNNYLKSMNMIGENEKITSIEYRKNIDLMTILTKVGLVENNDKTKEIISNFHEYLFKLGIELGISKGKQIAIDMIINEDVDMDLLMNVNPKDYTERKHSLFSEKEIKEFFK